MAIARLGRPSRRVLGERLTYLSPDKLATLERLAGAVDARGVPGSFLEAGIALGGSGIVLASLGGEHRRFDGYDVFGMIPPPSQEDPPEVHERYRVIVSGESGGIGGDAYYGYESDLLDKVRAAFARHGHPVQPGRVELHQGLFEDTLHPDGLVALAHVDSDWYEPVMLCLERVWPRLSPGGYVVLDDYNDYGGCTRAVDEFAARTREAILEQTKPNAVLRKAG